jgi:hypothetical protein
MRSKVARIVVALVVVALLSMGILGWALDRKPVVYSEPLPCFTMGQMVVCFDGGPSDNMECEMVDDHTVLCTAVD